MQFRRWKSWAAAVTWVTVAVATLGGLGGCAAPGGYFIDKQHHAVGQDSRVLFLILHFTAEPLESSLHILTQQKVSSHYLVTDEPSPRILQLVPEDRRAWHAGQSFWQGHAGLNASSIGIEIVNLGPRRRAGGGSAVYTPYPQAQVQAVLALVEDIVQRHGIRPERVLGHSDIAPQRKDDPGPLFPWQRLAERGLVPWPSPERVAAARTRFEAALPDAAWFQAELAQWGFQVPRTGELDEPTRRVITAFQMRYRPARHDGQPDAETAALLHALNSAKTP